MNLYPEAVNQLISQLKKIPGIGPKSAERTVVWFMEGHKNIAMEISSACVELANKINLCESCAFFADDRICKICQNAGREHKEICVVEHAQDIINLEKTKEFRGYYHCLGGKLSPLNDVTAEDLNIEKLLARIAESENKVSEVILALSSDIEGEATSNFLHDLLLKRFPALKVSRLAFGLPVIGGIENADHLSIIQALRGRRAF